MIAEAPAVLTAVIAVVLLAVAVGSSFDWRRPAAGPVQDLAAPPPPGGLGARIFAIGWRARCVTLLLRTAYLIVIGLTPLGARFVRLLAPGGGSWQVAVAWLVILAVLTATGLPARRARRRARALYPAIFRPPGRGGPRRMLLAAARAGYAYLALAWLASSASSAQVTVVSLAIALTGMFLIAPLFWVRLRRLAPSDRLTAALESLPVGLKPAPRAVAGWPRPIANAAAVSLPRQPMIIVAPPLASALTDRQLRAVVAHEAAHLIRRDQGRQRLRLYLMIMAAGATAVALYGQPGPRGLTELPGALTGQSLPFLLAVSYLVFQLLQPVSLIAERAEERIADRRMLQLTQDPAACAEALSILQSMLGTPVTWTWLQRLLMASHLAQAERQRVLLAAGPPAPARSADR